MVEENIPGEIEELKGEDYENKQPTQFISVGVIRIESLRRRMKEFLEQIDKVPVAIENKDWHVGAMWGLNKAELLFKDIFKDLIEESKIKCRYCGKELLSDEEDLCGRCLKEARCEG